MHVRGIAAALSGALVLVMGGMLGLPGLGGTATAATRDVQVVDNAYAPGSITIEVGDTVRWVWAGQGAHSVTAAGGQFDSHLACSALLPLTCGGPGSAFTHTFDTPGTFAYSCRVHGAAMSGTVVVRQPATSPSGGGQSSAPGPAQQAAPAGGAPAPPPPPPAAASGGHLHGRAAGPRVGRVPPPPPPAPQVAEASPRPVLSETSSRSQPQPRRDTAGDPAALAATAPADDRRQVLLLAAAAGVVVSGTVTGAVALFGRPRRR